MCLIKFIEWASRVLYFNRCKWSKYVCKANIIDNVFVNTLNYDFLTKSLQNAQVINEFNGQTTLNFVLHFYFIYSLFSVSTLMYK